MTSVSPLSTNGASYDYLLIISASCSLADGVFAFDQAMESITKIKDL